MSGAQPAHRNRRHDTNPSSNGKRYVQQGQGHLSGATKFHAERVMVTRIKRSKKCKAFLLVVEAQVFGWLLDQRLDSVIHSPGDQGCG